MADLITFLRSQLRMDRAIARDTLNNEVIAWDEARQRLYQGGWHSERAAQHIERHDPRRVLADVEAKGRMIDWCEEVIGDRDLSHYDTFGALKDDPNALSVTLAVEMLRLLALPYADHPNYRPEWRL